MKSLHFQPRKPATTPGDKLVGAVSHTALTIWSLIVILPLLWTFMSSFKTSSEIFASPFALPSVWRFDNYVKAWSEAGIGNYFLNSVVVVGSALVIVMVLGAMCAYVLSRYTFPGSRAIYYLMLAGLTFPIFLAMVPLFFVLKNIGLLNTLPGLIIVYVGFALPFTVFFLFSFFKSLPHEITEAAALDGAGEWRTFFQVMLPMANRASPRLPSSTSWACGTSSSSLYPSTLPGRAFSRRASRPSPARWGTPWTSGHSSRQSLSRWFRS